MPFFPLVWEKKQQNRSICLRARIAPAVLSLLSLSENCVYWCKCIVISFRAENLFAWIDLTVELSNENVPCMLHEYVFQISNVFLHIWSKQSLNLEPVMYSKC